MQQQWHQSYCNFQLSITHLWRLLNDDDHHYPLIITFARRVPLLPTHGMAWPGLDESGSAFSQAQSSLAWIGGVQLLPEL